MSQQEDYQKLARKFVDVWQEHMAAMLNDGEFTRVLLSMMQGNAFSAKDNVHANPFNPKPPGGATAAPDTRDAALAGLAASLAAIEKRLERLEHATTRSATGSRRKTTKSVGGTPRRSKTSTSRRARSTK
jgi:hypothetical protein